MTETVATGPPIRTLPGNPASAVYGTIIVAGQLAVESSTDHSTRQIVGSLIGTVIVFWLAHAYTDALGGVISGARSGPTFRQALRKEWPIVESGLVPLVVIAVAVLFGARSSTAALAGLVASTAEIAGWSALAARRAFARGWRLVLASLIGAMFGVAIIALKVLIH